MDIRGTRYDPWIHAELLGVTVIERRMRGTLWGEYVHRDRLIVLHRSMTRREARCTLAHEVAHALAADTPTRFGYLHRRQERRADWAAARRLVDPREYAASEQLRGPDFAAIADDLDVVPEVIADWLRATAARPGLL